MNSQEYAALIQELQILHAEAKMFPWKTSPEQVGLIGRLDQFYAKLKPVPLCGNLTAEHFKGQILGSKQERSGIVMDITHALSTHAFNCLSKEVDR